MAGMIVPLYWAEGRARNRSGGKQVTVRRWGWSDLSQDDAQRHADGRAQADLQRLLAGEKVRKREFRVAYNGADGVPIREEIVSRHGDTLVTRNGYGALCINTPDVLFADIDFPEQPSKGDESAARGRIARYIDAHRDWNARVYLTPKGLRVLVLQRLFIPASALVQEFFQALGTDPLYVRMCVKQFCFRARVSPKPWRVGIDRHFSPAVWPVNDDRKTGRDRWIAAYNRASADHASCRYLETLGRGSVEPDADAVRILHDDLSRALVDLPLA